jgi:hypothetical protein
MRPKRQAEQPQRELIRIDFEQLIGMSHPLVSLGLCIDWSSFEETLGSTFRDAGLRKIPFSASHRDVENVIETSGHGGSDRYSPSPIVPALRIYSCDLFPN